MSFYVKFRGKEVLEKMILVLEKSLIFDPKILYEPWFWRGSYAMPPADSAPVKKRFCVCLMSFVDCYQGSFKGYNGKTTYNCLSLWSLFLAFRFSWRHKEMWAGNTARLHTALPYLNAWNMQASYSVKITARIRLVQKSIKAMTVIRDPGQRHVDWGPGRCQILSVQRLSQTQEETRLKVQV